MATLKLEAAPNGSQASVISPKTPVSPAVAPRGTHPTLGTIAVVRSEFDDVTADMKVFQNFNPDRVLLAVSAHSARLTEIAIQISRVEAVAREWRPVGQECDRLLGELKNQFQIASRLHAMREFEWNADGRGQV